MMLKKWLAALLFVALIHLPVSAGRAGDYYQYADLEGVAYLEKLPCPEVHLEQLIEDELQARTADALSRWFIAYWSLREDWYHEFWNHETVILTEPYIIRVEEGAYRDVTVYCFACITSFSLFRGDDGERYFAEDLSDVRLFRVKWDGYDDPTRFADDVYCITSMDEELFPGAGYGTQGFPGLTDELIAEIPEQYWWDGGIAQRYLDLNGIDATIVAW